MKLNISKYYFMNVLLYLAQKTYFCHRNALSIVSSERDHEHVTIKNLYTGSKFVEDSVKLNVTVHFIQM